MLTVSLHGIKLNAFTGLYTEEAILGNDFEVDVDVSIPTSPTDALPFVDYTIIREVVEEAFHQPEKLLEGCIRNIHLALKTKFPQAQKMRIAIRKMHPPMGGEMKYAQVMLDF